MSTARIHNVVSSTEVVRAAIANTPKEYWDKLCVMRSAFEMQRAGSYLTLRPQQIDKLMHELDWEHYTHPAVKEPATAFMARDVPGRLGVVHISTVDEDAILTFEDPKGTGKFECVWHRGEGKETAALEVDFLVLLVGPPQAGTGDVVWTFHPGDPVAPSIITREDLERRGSEKRMLTKYARARGVEWVKLAPALGMDAAL